MKALPFAVIGATLLGWASSHAVAFAQQSGGRLATAEPRRAAAGLQLGFQDRGSSVSDRHSSSCTCAACCAASSARASRDSAPSALARLGLVP